MTQKLIIVIISILVVVLFVSRLNCRRNNSDDSNNTTELNENSAVDSVESIDGTNPSDSHSGTTDVNEIVVENSEEKIEPLNTAGYSRSSPGRSNSNETVNGMKLPEIPSLPIINSSPQGVAQVDTRRNSTALGRFSQQCNDKSEDMLPGDYLSNVISILPNNQVEINRIYPNNIIVRWRANYRIVDKDKKTFVIESSPDMGIIRALESQSIRFKSGNSKASYQGRFFDNSIELCNKTFTSK